MESPASFQNFRTNRAMLRNIINDVKMCKRSPTHLIIQFKVLINRLLMGCGRRHFDARQRQEAPKC